jgi:hypothetical protein
MNEDENMVRSEAQAFVATARHLCQGDKLRHATVQSQLPTLAMSCLDGAL